MISLFLTKISEVFNRNLEAEKIKELRIIIAGSRDFDNFEILFKNVEMIQNEILAKRDDISAAINIEHVVILHPGNTKGKNMKSFLVMVSIRMKMYGRISKMMAMILLILREKLLTDGLEVLQRSERKLL